MCPITKGMSKGCLSFLVSVHPRNLVFSEEKKKKKKVGSEQDINKADKQSERNNESSRQVLLLKSGLLATNRFLNKP